MNEDQIGVFVCHCGSNIAGPVDIPALLEYAQELPGVVITLDSTYMCSETGQTMIRDTIKEQNLTKVVIAACSPSLHENTFRRTVKNAGMNPYLLQIANIREGASWVHGKGGESLEKAKRILSGAVARVAEHKPLEQKHYSVPQDALVVGAGISGMEAALKIANYGKKVYLLDKFPSIGGHMA